MHEGGNYTCNQGNFKVSSKASCKINQEAEHDSFRYSCNQCDYTKNIKHGTKQQSTHDGFKFTCSKFEIHVSTLGTKLGVRNLEFLFFKFT